MHQTSRILYFVILLAVCAPGPIRAEAPYFARLGALPGGTLPSAAINVSGDGSVVVGASRRPGAIVRWDALRWTQTGGLVPMGDLPGGDIDSIAFGISDDGTTAVGESQTATGPQPFRWTESEGMVGLGFPGRATSVSSNGEVIVGYGSMGAYRWSSSSGAEPLGDLPGGAAIALVSDCSADGKTVVGYSYSGNGQEAFRWRPDTGMVGLGDLPGGSFSSNAQAISSNGEFIVGSSYSLNGTPEHINEAFLWSEQSGMIGLGDLPGGAFQSGASGVSGDGTIVVGSSISQTGLSAFIWRANTGMQDLAAVLSTEYGLSLPGWYLFEARSISANGMTIVGMGVNPEGLQEGWIAHIPEPSTCAFMVAGIVALLTRKSRVR